MKRTDRITVYRAEDGWRWNYRAKNGRIMADSGEAYRRRADCLRGVERVCGGMVAERWKGGWWLTRSVGEVWSSVPVVIEP